MTSSWFFLSTLNYDSRSTTHRQLLMMGTWLPETCSATIRREIKNTKSDIQLVLLIHTELRCTVSHTSDMLRVLQATEIRSEFWKKPNCTIVCGRSNGVHTLYSNKETCCTLCCGVTASEFYMPTFRDTLFHLFSFPHKNLLGIYGVWIGCSVF